MLESDNVEVWKTLRHCAHALGLSLREARRTDISQIKNLHGKFELEMQRRFGGDGKLSTLSTIEMRGHIDRGELFVLSRGEASTDVVGLVLSADVSDVSWSSSSSCLVGEVFVDRDLRGQGLAGLLLLGALLDAAGRVDRSPAVAVRCLR